MECTTIIVIIVVIIVLIVIRKIYLYRNISGFASKQEKDGNEEIIIEEYVEDETLPRKIIQAGN